MTGPQERLSRLGGSRALLIASGGLAVTAAVALTVGADDARLLRLGIVAALWAALLGTFTTVRARREVNSGATRAEELRMVYQLELEREVAARREHELLVQRDLREQFEQRERAELAALRGELQTLREALQHLLGGDVLVERVALRAESTRLLPLPDSRAAADSAGRGPATEMSRTPHSLSSSPWPIADDSQDRDSPQRRRQTHFAAEQPAEVPGRGVVDPVPSRWEPWDARPRSSVELDIPQRDIPQRDIPQRDIPQRDVPQQQRSRDIPSAAPAAGSRTVGDAGATDHRRGDSHAGADSGAAAGRRARSEPNREWSPAVTGTAAAWEAVTSSSEQAGRQGRRHRAEPDPLKPAPAQSAIAAGRRAGTSPDPDPSATRHAPARGKHGTANEPGREPLGAAGRHTSPAHGSNGAGSPSTGSHSAGSPSTGSPSTGSHSAGSHSAGSNGAGSNGAGAHSAGSNGAGSPGPGAARNGSPGTGSHSTTGGFGRTAAEQHGMSGTGAHSGGRSVDDLLAAYSEGSPSRRRRRHADD